MKNIDEVKVILKEEGWSTDGYIPPNPDTTNNSKYVEYTKGDKKAWLGSYFLEVCVSGLALPWKAEDCKRQDVVNFLNGNQSYWKD